jgi:osmotically-inducible protein OsmY
MRPIASVMGLVLAALLLTGAAGASPLGPALEANSDDWVTVKIQTALYQDLRFMGRGVTVDTVQGVVTLRGKVDSDADKAAAAAIARGMAGVTEVRSELTVVPPAERAQVEAADGQISRVLKERLAREPGLQSERIDSRVDAGVVTLLGEVSSGEARDRAAEIARGVPGVREVRNELAYLSQPGVQRESGPRRARSSRRG